MLAKQQAKMKYHIDKEFGTVNIQFRLNRSSQTAIITYILKQNMWPFEFPNMRNLSLRH